MEKLRARLSAVLPPEEQGAFFDALLRLGEAPRKSIRFNALRPAAREFWILLGLPLGDPIPWCSRGYWIDAECLKRPEADLFFAAGFGYVQEASAMEVVEALDLSQPDLRVLDLCAAPGGKSTQIGEMLQGKGELLSNEVDRDRVRVLDSLLLRQGVTASTVYSLFSRDLAEKFPRYFDRILVDAPCSSESFFAKRTEKREDVSDTEVRRCAKKQLKILADASRMAKSGAVLVYSTCTYSRDENEDVVEDFLAEHTGWTLVRSGRRFPHRDGVPGGFFAVLRAPTDLPQQAETRTRIKGTQGLLREGLRRWNGEEDLYGLLTAGDRESAAVPEIELSTEEALEFCRGRGVSALLAKVSADPQAVLWRGKRIGGIVKREARVDLILPKGLRLRS